MDTEPFHPTEVGEPLEASISAVKRGVYLVTVPVLVLALGVFTAFSWFTGELVGVEAWVLPVSLVALAAATIALWKRWLALRIIEYGLIAVAVAGLLFLMVDAGLGASRDDAASLNILTWLGYWLPVLYGFLFMVFGVRTGSIVSFVLFGVAMLTGLSHFIDPSGHSASDLLALGQTYLSNVVIIVVLIGVTTILQRQAWHSDRLEVQVHTDVLTGLPNRRLLGRMIVEEAARADRYDRPFSVVLLDLDHFKLVNDQHGHAVGDEVLKMIGPLLAEHVRETDTVGRWGGEEFLVILPEMDVSAASQMAERLRRVIEDAKFPHEIHLTASFGVARFRREGSMADLLHRADMAMYAAKDAGRNRVEPPPPNASDEDSEDSEDSDDSAQES